MNLDLRTPSLHKASRPVSLSNNTAGTFCARVRLQMGETEGFSMRAMFVAAFCVGSLVFGSASADAKGCIKGAIIGGIAGHMAGHGVAGAVAGCAVGSGASHYMKKHNSQDALRRDQQQITPPAMQQQQ